MNLVINKKSTYLINSLFYE